MQRDGGPGGGAGGLGSGGSFTGAAEALEIVGDFSFAYSGAVTITSAAYTTALSFTSGNYLAVTGLQVGTVDVTGADLFYKIKLNGTVILEQANNNPAGTGADPTPIRIVIPPYTQVEISGKRGSGSDYDVYFNLTGRIYRG